MNNSGLSIVLEMVMKNKRFAQKERLHKKDSFYDSQSD
jgi:hypothetical protein